MAVAMAKAKAEAAQARAAHAQREIQLKVEQARIQANLDALNDEKEKDAAIAEANALMAGLQDMGFEARSEANSLASQSIKDQRIVAFVSEQASLCSKVLSDKRESNNASPTFHPPYPQPTSVMSSTPHLFNTSQTQTTASDIVMPHHAPQDPQPSGTPPQQSFNQPFYSSPAPQLS